MNSRPALSCCFKFTKKIKFSNTLTTQPEISQLVDHLFRHESGKLVSVLTRIFGAVNLSLAEDVVQDSLVEAINHWQYEGVPDNPSAWLFRVAKNKALNFVNREKNKLHYSSDVVHYLQSKWTVEPALDLIFSEQEIQDDQLRMIFTCCHPAISRDSQIALALKTLCGFSIPEIARAFLTTEENINKRLVRARKNIRLDKIAFEIPQGNELGERLNAVLETVYLLFNEGYSASKGDEIIRYELCEEAIRLAQMIAENKVIEQKENVLALLALMFLNASRFKARQDIDGSILTMAEQDRSLWDKNLKDTGLKYLNEATQNNKIGFYHIMAAISANHSMAPDFDSTNWQAILTLYDILFEIDNSPLVLLNRTIAILKVYGAERAIAELEKIEDIPSLKTYHLLYSTKAEFYIQLHQYAQAAEYLEKSIQFVSLKAEREMLQAKLDSCIKKII
jgi:RNA polymerase sigma-70 factor (ECF subfamily)